MTPTPDAICERLDAASVKLCALHNRLLSCFQSPTGQPPLRRPRLHTPAMEDCENALDGALALEHAKATIERLSAALEEARAFVAIQGPAEAFPDVLATIDAALGKDVSNE